MEGCEMKLFDTIKHFSKDESGEVTTGDVLSVAFVPLTGEH